ncbi:RNA ligase family protein [Chitinophaga qingshengii]|uniref:2'-5' RNA ligase n=1 Tax=Chitinophaga qingshengii TaxID=1569794 RepID=A0ABR7TQQ7_9BACT|nr:RNA ligase family protein [Chitinophaga qingshengii]MBC9932811.1 2'-5' RNA ligase [Chitinophaga qingshengii]
MPKHSEYEKMPKNLKGLHLSEKAMQDLNKLKWVVTEKIHGANFSFVYEDHQLLYAKRKDYLQWTDDFFGFQAVVADMEDKVVRLFEQLMQDMPAQRYILYGELFGGRYPHPDVAPIDYVQAIQTGVYYSPDIRFCAFDLAVENAVGEKRYIDYDTAVAYFERFDIFYAKILFAGKWNEALNFDTRINSAIPAQLNLPDIGSNLIEGVVVKPLRHSGLPDPGTRPVIKLKNAEFDEEKKFHEAEKWSFIPAVSSRSEQLSFLVTELARYVTANRLNSVLSKVGRLDTANGQRMEEIKTAFLEDVYTDFREDNGDILAELDAADAGWVRDRVAGRIAALIEQAR